MAAALRPLGLMFKVKQDSPRASSLGSSHSSVRLYFLYPPVFRCCGKCSFSLSGLPRPGYLPCSFNYPSGGGCGVCVSAQVSLGSPGKQSRVPPPPHPREARLLARPPGVAEPPPSRSVWTPARPASVNGTFFSSSGCYWGGAGRGGAGYCGW